MYFLLWECHPPCSWLWRRHRWLCGFPLARHWHYKYCNPHNAVRPDFTTDEYEDARIALIGTGVPAGTTAIALAQIWTFNNDRDKTEWDRAVADEVQAKEAARQLAVASEELLRQQELADKEAALSKERKKLKNKFVPVPKAKALVDLICLPAKYALKHMENGTYVELFYFTNQGIADAEEVATAPSDESFVWKQQDNGTPSLVEASTAKRGLKTDMLPDEKLSWEQFFEATPRIIQFMKRYHWPQDRIDMFCSFFLGIQSHRWRTSSHPLCKKSLLFYQAKQRRLWHHTIGSDFGFTLAEIEEEVLRNIRDELMQTSFSVEFNKMQSVSFVFPPPSSGLHGPAHNEPRPGPVTLLDHVFTTRHRLTVPSY